MTKGSLFFLFTVAGAFACIGVAALASAHESTSHVSIRAGRVYRVSSPLPEDAGDRVEARNGLATVGAVIERETATTVTYVIRALHDRAIALGKDSFDFANMATGRDVRLVISSVEAVA